MATGTLMERVRTSLAQLWARFLLSLPVLVAPLVRSLPSSISFAEVPLQVHHAVPAPGVPLFLLQWMTVRVGKFMNWRDVCSSQSDDVLSGSKRLTP